MMPTLPPLPADIDDHLMTEEVRIVEDWALAYGHAVAEACAVICDEMRDKHLNSQAYRAVAGDKAVRAGGLVDGSAYCAISIREAAKDVGR